LISTDERTDDVPMHGSFSKLSLVVALSAATCAACEDGSQGPQVASSAEQVGYAERYPEAVQLLSADLEGQTQSVTSTASELAAFPDALKDPDWTLVEQVYEAAHEEGKSHAYSQRHEEQRTVQRFFEQEKKPIVGRVAGGAQHAAKEKGYEIQLHGPVSFSLERAIEQQLQERKRADSTAHLTIEEQKEVLGKGNVDTLQEQADKLALASHIVHVRMATDQRELAERIDEASSVRSTLEERREKLKAAEKPDKDAIARTDAALAGLDETVNTAQAQLDGAEERTRKQRDDYEAAFEALLDEVQKRAGQSTSE
jgi:hypothetical protein